MYLGALIQEAGDRPACHATDSRTPYRSSSIQARDDAPSKRSKLPGCPVSLSQARGRTDGQEEDHLWIPHAKNGVKN
jgi:hypothetical protein